MVTFKKVRLGKCSWKVYDKYSGEKKRSKKEQNEKVVGNEHQETGLPELSLVGPGHPRFLYT